MAGDMRKRIIAHVADILRNKILDEIEMHATHTKSGKMILDYDHAIVIINNSIQEFKEDLEIDEHNMEVHNVK